MKSILGNTLFDLDPKVKVKGNKACICDGVPLTAALDMLTVFRVQRNTEIIICYSNMSFIVHLGTPERLTFLRPIERLTIVMIQALRYECEIET